MFRTARQSETAERAFLYELPLVVLIAAVLVEVVAPGVSTATAGWPLVVSLFLFGMPHGAIDFSLTAQLTRSRTIRSQLLNFVGYTAVLIASLIIFVATPTAALVLFLLLSAAHFGLADSRILDSRFAVTTTPWIKTLSAATRGVFVIALPFVFHPEGSLKVFADIVSITGKTAPGLAPTPVVVLATVVVSCAILVHTLVTIGRLRVGQRAAAGMEMLESGIIWLAFFTLHPLFAIGLYVFAWHSWRHIVTLLQLQPFSPTGRTPRQFIGAMFRFHLQSLPLLLPTLAIFAAVAWWRLDVWSAESLAALTIAFFVVVTLPHHLLIERLFAQPNPVQRSHNVNTTNVVVAGGRKSRGSLHTPFNIV